jgi:hypothetical protein
MCFGARTSVSQAYCALVIMMDEAIGNTVCALDRAGLSNNALVVVSSDNGGWNHIAGSNYPFRGSKGAMVDGGVHVPSFIYGSLIPESARGNTYEGLVHITDWYVTFLRLASGGAWVAPANGAEVDGLDLFDAIAGNTASPRYEIFHNYSPETGRGAMQIGSVKYVLGELGRPINPDSKLYAGQNLPPESCDALPPLASTFLSPIPAPTSLPIPLPMAQPIPASTQLPVPASTPNPIPLPTAQPISAPTSLPVPVPTTLPVPAPTSLPTTTLPTSFSIEFTFSFSFSYQVSYSQEHEATARRTASSLWNNGTSLDQKAE